MTNFFDPEELPKAIKLEEPKNKYESTKVCTYCGNRVIKTDPKDHWCPKCGHSVII